MATEFTTSTELDLSSLSGVLSGAYRARSAFAQATTSHNIGIGESSVAITLSPGDITEFVSEGGTKPATDALSKVRMRNQKLAFIQIFTDELDAVAGQALQTALTNHAPARFAKLYDNAVAGVVSVPDNNDFHNLAAAPEIVLSTADAYAKINEALGEVDNPSAFVMSSKLYYALRGVTTTTGAPVIGSTGAGVKEIVGVPTYVFPSNERIGYVGDFENAAVHSLSTNPIVRIARDGTVTDVNGVTHNLTQENKRAAIVEYFAAFAAANVADNFRKLTWDAAQTEPEA